VFDHEWFCERAEKEISTLVAVVAAAPDIAADVPSCPGWTIADLAEHAGSVHRWAAAIIETRATARVPFPEASAPWASADGLAQWLAAGAVPLLAALRSAGPLTDVWSWGPGRTSGWWARRMLHETAVHRADAELALGREPEIDPDVAADGIEELLTNLPYGRRTAGGLADLPGGGETVHLHATDRDGEWMITLGPDGMTWRRGHGKGDAAVRGPAVLLLLFVYGRVPPDDARLSVFGDGALLRTWLEKTAL
jgi:uncharacterized protein (TIGR03083 family)